MPTYDLVCASCGARFEKSLRRFIRDEDKLCERCGSSDVNVRPGGFAAIRRAPAQSGCAPRGRSR